MQRQQLPVTPSHPAQTVAGNVNDPIESRHAAAVRRETRILIVDDEVLLRLDTEDVLTAAGYLVVGAASTADEAIDLAARSGPHLILMDIHIRGSRDGIEAAIEIRQRYGIRSLFVTANSDADTRERASAAEPTGFVDKPYSNRRLLAAVQASLSEAPDGS